MYSEKNLKKILQEIKNGKLSVDDGFNQLSDLPYKNLECARIDHHRHIRKGIPEAVFAQGKTRAQLGRIIETLKDKESVILITRLEHEMFLSLHKEFSFLNYLEDARIAYYRKRKINNAKSRKLFAVLTAGTCDIPVAEEASATLEIMGAEVKRYFDCGVAGIHRLTDIAGDLRKADAIICIAGMEGALPSVVAGLVNKPVIAVPTSVGYGTSFGGVAPLLSMLNSCAQGIAVVNIDNGFGAACFALLL